MKPEQVQQDGQGNTVDPNYKFTDEELQRTAELDDKGAEQMKEIVTTMTKAGSNPPDEDTTSGHDSSEYDYWRVVGPGPDGYYREPNDHAHRNYCGPGATMVALYGKLRDFSQVPNTVAFFDLIGRELRINPDWGCILTTLRQY